MTSQSETVSAAIWRFAPGSTYELELAPNTHTDLVSMPIAGRCHHTYFGDGRKEWSRTHPAFHEWPSTAAFASR